MCIYTHEASGFLCAKQQGEAKGHKRKEGRERDVRDHHPRSDFDFFSSRLLRPTNSLFV